MKLSAGKAVLLIVLALGAFVLLMTLTGCATVQPPKPTEHVPRCDSASGVLTSCWVFDQTWVWVPPPPALDCPLGTLSCTSLPSPVCSCKEPVCQPGQTCGCWVKPPGEDWRKLPDCGGPGPQVCTPPARTCVDGSVKWCCNPSPSVCPQLQELEMKKKPLADLVVDVTPKGGDRARCVSIGKDQDKCPLGPEGPNHEDNRDRIECETLYGPYRFTFQAGGWGAWADCDTPGAPCFHHNTNPLAVKIRKGNVGALKVESFDGLSNTVAIP